MVVPHIKPQLIFVGMKQKNWTRVVRYIKFHYKLKFCIQKTNTVTLLIIFISKNIEICDPKMQSPLSNSTSVVHTKMHIYHGHKPVLLHKCPLIEVCYEP